MNDGALLPLPRTSLEAACFLLQLLAAGCNFLRPLCARDPVTAAARRRMACCDAFCAAARLALGLWAFDAVPLTWLDGPILLGVAHLVYYYYDLALRVPRKAAALPSEIDDYALAVGQLLVWRATRRVEFGALVEAATAAAFNAKLEKALRAVRAAAAEEEEMKRVVGGRERLLMVLRKREAEVEEMARMGRGTGGGGGLETAGGSTVVEEEKEREARERMLLVLRKQEAMLLNGAWEAEKKMMMMGRSVVAVAG